MTTTLSLLLSTPVAAVSYTEVPVKPCVTAPVWVASSPAGAVGRSGCIPVGMATRSGKPLPLLKDPDGPRSPTNEPISDLGQRCRGDGGGGSGIIPAARSAAPPPYGWPFLWRGREARDCGGSAVPTAPTYGKTSELLNPAEARP